MARDALAREAKQLIDQVAAEPRAAGSEGEARSRALCAAMLREKGYTVAAEEFFYSAFAGLWAVPLVGLLLLAWFILVGSQARSNPAGAVRSGLPFLLLLPALGYMLARMIQESRWMARRGTNLVATRGESPAIWLVAHLDTKSQPVPMLARIAGIVAAAVALPLSVLAAVAGLGRELPPAFWMITCGLGALGSLAMCLSLVGDRSPGAVDDASGVAAVLLAATGLPRDAAAAVLLTSAEELGLQGGKAWARRKSMPPGLAINFDGIDDVGILTCMARRSSKLAGRIRASAELAGIRVKLRRVLPGIMVDALALGAAGWDAVTISRGNFSTLARIHTPGDGPDRLTGAGVAEAVEMVTNFIQREV